MGTPSFVKSRDERKKVEMRFAHLKTHHRFERMRLRGLSGARDDSTSLHRPEPEELATRVVRKAAARAKRSQNGA